MIENNQLVVTPVHIGSKWKPGQRESRTATSFEMVNSKLDTREEILAQLAMVGVGLDEIHSPRNFNSDLHMKETLLEAGWKPPK